MKSEVDMIVQPGLKFAFEDTSEGCYRDFIQILLDNNWVRIPVRKKSRMEKKLSIIKREETPLLYSVLNEKDIDFDNLEPNQIVNHFQGIAKCMTTKSGYCDLLKSMNWKQIDNLSISPR